MTAPLSKLLETIERKREREIEKEGEAKMEGVGIEKFLITFFRRSET